MKKFKTLLLSCVKGGFSDIHITGGHPVVFRKDGVIGFAKGDIWSHDEMDAFASKILKYRQFQILHKRWSVDLALSVSNVRLRMNIFSTSRGLSIAVRILPGAVPTIGSLNLHPSLHEISLMRAGLVLICGPTGCGKSTTAAALIGEINNNLPRHIVTLEDPIEYKLVSKKSFVEQRELGTHVHSFQQGLIDVLREDPDVIMVGELRDPETIRMALNAAESGHLVIASLHSSNSEDALYRMFNSFPPDAQEAIHTQLAATVGWLIVQQLQYIQKAGFRVPVLSILRGTAAVKNLIRDNKLAQLENAMQTARAEGMFTREAYRKDYLDKVISFQSPSEIFSPSDESAQEEAYYSGLLDPDASYRDPEIDLTLIWCAMEKVKVYLDEARRGFVVCQKCGKSKQIQFASGGNPRSGVAKCACGNAFAVIFENRKYYRKPLSSYGVCLAAKDTARGASVKLVDVSQSGIRFIKKNGRPLQLNEKIRVSFSLNNYPISCVALVNNIGDECIGAKFISLDEHSQKILGFFLLR